MVHIHVCHLIFCCGTSESKKDGQLFVRYNYIMAHLSIKFLICKRGITQQIMSKYQCQSYPILLLFSDTDASRKCQIKMLINIKGKGSDIGWNPYVF